MTQDFLRWKEQLFDRWAPTYDWLFPSVVYQAIHKRLLEYISLSDQSNVLDLGCGTGRLLDRLADQFPTLQGTGLDLSGEMLHQARQRNRYPSRLKFEQGNAEALPFGKGQFNAVFNTLSFLHYPHPQQVFTEVGRVLRPQGHFYLVDPTFRRWNNGAETITLPSGIRFYSLEAREQLGQNAGLHCQGHHYLLGPVVLTVFLQEVTPELTSP